MLASYLYEYWQVLQRDSASVTPLIDSAGLQTQQPRQIGLTVHTRDGSHQIDYPIHLAPTDLRGIFAVLPSCAVHQSECNIVVEVLVGTGAVVVFLLRVLPTAFLALLRAKGIRHHLCGIALLAVLRLPFPSPVLALHKDP